MFGLFKKPDEHVKREGESVFKVRIRTHKHGEIVELRLTKGNEISPEGGGYYVRKQIVGSQHFDRAVLELWFDRGYRPSRKEVEGGELVPIKEWE